MNRRMMVLGHVLVLWLLLFPTQSVFAEVSDFTCGPLKNGYGPFDYRSDKDKLDIVEGAHLTPDVVNLIRGNTGALGGDIDYTLRAFPNHHRALMAMVRLGEKLHQSKPQGAHYSVECYLYRASKFQPDDGTVKMIYANYLAKNGRGFDALKYLDEVVALGEENANLYYNMGLIYLDMKQYDKALSYAHRAYQMGFPLPGLRDRLKKIGKWSEPPPKVSSQPNSGPDESAEMPAVTPTPTGN